MIIYKYIKMYPANLAGHVDTLRTLMRTFRRAKANVTYSQGYNPHMDLYFSPALGLGCESTCEYVGTKGKSCDLDKLNSVSAPGIRFVECIETEDVNLAAAVTSADYIVKGKGVADLHTRLQAQPFNIVQLGKDGDKIKDVSERIFSVTVVDEDTLKLNLACGNDNVRPDKLFSTLNFEPDSIVKTEMFVGNETVDCYLNSHKLN